MLTTFTFWSLTALASIVRATTYDVIVGGATLTYTPEYVHAYPGDTIRFHFQQKNHTATQSSFDSPCTPWYGGFDSGFMPVADGATYFPYYDVQVYDTNPIWVHCRQVNHCQQGMVFAVNPPDYGNTFEAFKAKAMATYTYTPIATDYYPTTTYYDSYTTAYSTYPQEHTIVVGGDAGNVYTPNNIKAQVGDIVKFEFRQKNHTVTQSSFDDPCLKLEFSYPGQIGFDSGFNFPVGPDVTANFPTWSLIVNDTKPIWGYCRQTGHCGQGMVFAINADDYSDHSFAAFQALAIQKNGTTV